MAPPMLDPGLWSAGSIPWRRRLARMTEWCQAWSVLAIQLHGHGDIQLSSAALGALHALGRLDGGEGGKGSSDSPSEYVWCV